MSGKGVKDEELMSLKLDKPGRVKSQEQLAKHTIDTQFEDKPIERSVYLLTKGDDVQKLSIVQNLPQLYQFEPNATVNRILPKIQQELPGSSSEFNIAAARIFQTLIQKKVPVNLLSSILQGIDSRDPLVATTWIETLLEVINHLSEIQIRSDVLKWAVQKSAPNKPTLYRVASCHLLGRCAIHPKIQSIEVKTTILPLVQGLAQDVSFEVRACIAGQLANIAQGLNDANLVKSSLLPSVIELAKDTNGVVRSASIVAVSQLLQHFGTDTKQEYIIPLFKELCNQTSEEGEGSYPILAREFGKYMTGLQNVFTQADAVWFLKFFKILSLKGLGSSQGDNVDPTQKAYRESTLSKMRAYDSGRDVVEDFSRSDRPSTSSTEDNIDKVKEMVIENRRLSLRETGNELSVSPLKRLFGMKRVAARLVPEDLNFLQKFNSVKVAECMLEQVNYNPTCMKRIETGDETWVDEFNMQTSQQASE